MQKQELTKQQIVARVEELLVPIVAETEIEIFDVEFLKEGPSWYLRIYIDKPNGVDLDDCEFVSRKIDVLLDSKDFIKQSYTLEVSSPGIDRKLKKDSDFIRYAGQMVDVKLYKAIEKTKEFQGHLKGLKDGKLTITLENGSDMVFDYEDVSSVRLAVVF